MAEYAAHVTTDIEEVPDEQLDDLVDALAPVSGVPSMHGGRLSVQITLPEAAGITSAASLAVRSALRYVHDALGGNVDAVAVEVMTAEEFERRQGLPTEIDDLVSTSEAADMLDVSRQRILQLADTYPDTFPKPCRLGARGLHWSAADLRRFAANWPRKPGGPRTGAEAT